MKRNVIFALLLTIVMLPAIHAQTKEEKKELAKIEKEISKNEKKLAKKVKKQAKMARKEARKQIEEKDDSLQYINAKAALTNGSFVVEAQSIRLDISRTFFVSSSLNFILMRNLKEGTIQIGQNGPISGPNGVGGITVEGNIDNVEMTTDPRGNLIYTYDIWGSNVSAKVSVTLYKNSTRANVVVRPNFKRYDLIIEGLLVPLNESAIFEGRSL